jgi:RNA polymerase sigma-70 factor (ECF subfamily)
LLIGPGDFDALRALGWEDAQVFEAVLVSAWERFVGMLSAGLGVGPDFEPGLAPPGKAVPEMHGFSSAGSPPESGPYLARPAVDGKTFPPFLLFKKAFGFVPNIYRAQTLRPDVLEAEALCVRDILLANDALKREQKEYILLAVSGANRNSYFVTVHGEVLRSLGIEPEVSDQVAADHHHSGLSTADKALLDALVKLATRTAEFGEADVQALRAQGFADRQILEAIVMAALASMWNTLQIGLGAVPDFPPRPNLAVTSSPLNPKFSPDRLREDADGCLPLPEDPDSPAVARARAGDLSAFEDLVRRYQARVYRTLMGVTRNVQDAEDGTQAVFINVFRKIGGFTGGARFSTWLTRIALNEAVERVRGRKEWDSLEERDESEFRPSRLQAWVEDPESRFARRQMREIVHEALGRLPVRYRAAVLLRDIEQLSTAEAAEVLELPISTLKTRLLRGRLMLREELAVRFSIPLRPSAAPREAEP